MKKYLLGFLTAWIMSISINFVYNHNLQLDNDELKQKIELLFQNGVYEGHIIACHDGVEQMVSKYHLYGSNQEILDICREHASDALQKWRKGFRK